MRTDAQIVVISFFRFKGIFQKIWAFTQMGFARKKLKNIKEISFFKLFGSGTGEGLIQLKIGLFFFLQFQVKVIGIKLTHSIQ